MSFPGIHIWTDIRHLDHKKIKTTELPNSNVPFVFVPTVFVILESRATMFA